MKYVANPVEVEAKRITDISCHEGIGLRKTLRLTLEDGSVVYADPGMTARMVPEPGDYFVLQSDAYAYLNPRSVFERKYSPMVASMPITGIVESTVKEVVKRLCYGDDSVANWIVTPDEAEKALVSALKDAVWPVMERGTETPHTAILCYRDGKKMVTVLGREDASWGPEFFALLICDIARHVARAFEVAENYVWDRIDMERVNPTTDVETLRPQ